MSPKLILYILIIPAIMWLLESLNINSIFKKERQIQARIIYMIIGILTSYFLVNFIYDFYELSKIY